MTPGSHVELVDTHTRDTPDLVGAIAPTMVMIDGRPIGPVLLDGLDVVVDADGFTIVELKLAPASVIIRGWRPGDPCAPQEAAPAPQRRFPLALYALLLLAPLTAAWAAWRRR